MIKRMSLLVQILVLLSFFSTIHTASAQANEPELKLSMSRDFGYSSGTGRIQGTFSMKVSGPEDLVRVVFMIDGETINEDSEAPYRYQFHTDSYALTEHTLSAAGYTSDGRELTSNEIKVIFVSSEEGGEMVVKILVPLFAVIFGLMALSYLGPGLFNRGKRKEIPLGQPRNYGLSGGTICPKCNRPFPLNLLAMNLMVGKLDRCPHCGKFGIVHRYPLEMLRSAEAAELAGAQKGNEEVKEITEAEKIQRALDDSRFQDL